MYAPHTVTLYNVIQEIDMQTFKETERTYITILNGVFLDAVKAANVRQSGLESADAVSLYIPFDVNASDRSPNPEMWFAPADYDGILSSDGYILAGYMGPLKRYVSPAEFMAATDRSGIWTLTTAGDAGETFFVKGVYIGTPTAARAQDGSYAVTKVDIKDYGRPHMRHFEVGGA